MFSIANLLDSAKAKANIESDYRLAIVIGISHQAMSHYRAGNTLPSEKVIEQICALSGDDPDVVAAEIQASRSKSPEAKNMWLRIAARMAGGATTAVLSVIFAISLLAGGAHDARASGLSDAQVAKLNKLYIVSITILSVHCFALVRLLRFKRLLPAFFGLCRCVYL